MLRALDIKATIVLVSCATLQHKEILAGITTAAKVSHVSFYLFMYSYPRTLIWKGLGISWNPFQAVQGCTAISQKQDWLLWSKVFEDDTVPPKVTFRSWCNLSRLNSIHYHIHFSHSHRRLMCKVISSYFCC